MNNIKLFCDRIGHPSRFCLHFLQLNKIPHKEVPVLLLKGEPAKHPELPFGKVPVFKGTLTGSTYDEVVITESTTILKYLADKLPNDKWYPKNPEKRVKVDEFTDFFHFSMNASLIRTIQAKVFYRMMFKRTEPDWNIINANMEKFQQAEKDLLSYYLGKNDFIGGKDLNICDLIATSTFEQAMLLDYEQNPETQKYIERCKEKIDGYDQMLIELKKVPGFVKMMHDKYDQK